MTTQTINAINSLLKSEKFLEQRSAKVETTKVIKKSAKKTLEASLESEIRISTKNESRYGNILAYSLGLGVAGSYFLLDNAARHTDNVINFAIKYLGWGN